MTFTRLLALAAIIVFLVCVAVPTTFLSVANGFWLGLSFAFFLLDSAGYGGYTLSAPTRQTGA